LREYEFTFVVQPEITDEGLQSLCEKFEGLLDRSGATRLFYEDWGRRRLAYEIKRFQKGHYLVLHYLDEGKTVPELERVARLEDSVLRFLTVLADDKVTDIEARKAEAVTLEEERKQKAIERAAREAEEAAARAAEAEEAARRATEAGEAADRAAEAARDEESAEAAGDVESAGDEESAEAAGEVEDTKDAETPPAGGGEPLIAPASELDADDVAPAENADEAERPA
jgi:small subunit ribosomal protein S6